MKGIKQDLLSKGLIWLTEDGLWHKKCPFCFSSQKYTTYSMCIQKLKENTKCNSCAKSGKNNPCYGKSLSDDCKNKIRTSLTGFKYGPCPVDRRLKISNTKKKNPTSNGSNQFKWKSYTFPDGRIENVQGWEPWTLDLLLSSSISPTDIKIKNDRPVISYNWSGSAYRYLPDCYISSSNTIVETKSSWTWKINESQNLSKLSSSLDSGYNVRLVIWEDGRKLISDKTYDA